MKYGMWFLVVVFLALAVWVALRMSAARMPALLAPSASPALVATGLYEWRAEGETLYVREAGASVWRMSFGRGVLDPFVPRSAGEFGRVLVSEIADPRAGALRFSRRFVAEEEGRRSPTDIVDIAWGTPGQSVAAWVNFFALEEAARWGQMQPITAKLAAGDAVVLYIRPVAEGEKP